MNIPFRNTWLTHFLRGGGWQGIRDFILTRGSLITTKCALERIQQKVYLWTYFLSKWDCAAQLGSEFKKKKKKVNSFVNRKEMCFG